MSALVTSASGDSAPWIAAPEVTAKASSSRVQTVETARAGTGASFRATGSEAITGSRWDGVGGRQPLEDVADGDVEVSVHGRFGGDWIARLDGAGDGVVTFDDDGLVALGHPCVPGRRHRDPHQRRERADDLQE